jgi:hypothetical protein
MLSNKELVTIAIILLSVGFLICTITRIESFNPKNPRNLIGDAKTDVANLTRINAMIIPLRDHVHTWIVKVPLTPFRAPLVIPPLDGKPLPPFLLYKPDFLTPAQNQGECGSCWAFSLAHMLADRVMIATGGRFRKNLSVQELLSCFDRTGCEGGSPEDACFWLADSGTELYTDVALPYKQQKSLHVSTACKTAKGDAVKVNKDSIKSIVEFIPEKGYSKDILQRNINSMKRELVEGGVFYCAMTVYEDFFSYTGLKPYKPSKNSKVIGGHAIEVVGYCDKGQDPRTGFKRYGYWICKNSWTDGWPTQTTVDGFFTIVMGSNICGIESRCGSAVPELHTEGELVGEPLPLTALRYETFKEYLKA